MIENLNDYLDHFKANLKIDSAIKDSVVHELHTHLEDKSQELKENGISEDAANDLAALSLGSPDLIAREIYEAHAQGSWQEAFFAALPHFLVALLFASYYWQNTFCLSIILVTTVGTAIYGWYHDKPLWLFPWLGYYLLPVIFSGILLISLPKGWSWVAALVYIPLALFVLIYIVRQTARRDWLYAPLMLAPVLVVFSWLSFSGIEKDVLTSNLWIAKLQPKIPWIVISFLVLAAATVTFIRIKQRWCKTIALLIPPIIILALILVALASRGNINLWGWLIMVFSLFVFATPVWLQARSQ